MENPFQIELKNVGKKCYKLMKEIRRDERGNPFTLDDTIRSMILKNPGMIQYRDTALDILYCVLGAGIHWIDDRVGDSSPNNYINMPPSDGTQECWSHDFGRDESLDAIYGEVGSKELAFHKAKQMHAENQRAQEIIDTVRDIDIRCQQYSPVPNTCYPISWYACRLCVPKGAQEDFRNGALEVLHLILRAEPEYGTQHWIDHQRTKRYAQEILEALGERE